MNKYYLAIFSNVLFFGINTLFFLLITPIALKVMGDELYGLWAIINAISIFSSVGTLGMSNVVNKYASEKGEFSIDIGAIHTTGILVLIPMAVLIAGILILSRSWISSQIDTTAVYRLQFEQAILITAISLLPQFLVKVPQGYLLSQLRNNLMRLVESGTNIAFWIGSVLVALATKNLVLIAVWALIVQIASGIIYFGIIAREGVLKWQYNRRAMRSMLDFSVFSFIESVAISLYQLIDRVIVGLTLGPAAAGVYSVGSSVGTRISMVAGQISDVMVPYASLKGSLQEYPKLLDVYRLLNRFFSLFLALLSSLLILWMKEILAIWISPDYSAVYYQFFCVMILAYSAISLARPGLQTLDGIGKIRISALVYLANSLIMLVGVYVLSVKYGLLGAGLANLLMLGLLLLNAVAYKILSGTVAWKTLLTDLALGLILPGMAYLVILVSNDAMLRILVSILILVLIVYLSLQDQQLMAQLRLLSSQVTQRAYQKNGKGAG